MRFDTVKKVLVYSDAGNHYCSKYILQGITRAVCEPTGLYGAVCMCKGCVNLQRCELGCITTLFLVEPGNKASISQSQSVHFAGPPRG